MDKILAVVGPTAVGKSDLAVKLAKRYNGEIISCDSMQIYKNMDIGTAKPTKEEMQGIKHHMIDILSSNENFSCADYAEMAKSLIKELQSENITPVFCGGTGLYLSSVLEINSFENTKKDDEYRQELESFYKQHGARALHEKLELVDKESADAIHENNVKRVIRALEIYKCTGMKKSYLDKKAKETKPEYNATVLYLTFKDRDKLCARIDERVDLMIKNGLLDEVKNLYSQGLLKSGTTASEAIGYKELIPYIESKETFDNCVEKLKISTHQYAKRQMTWFNKKNYKKIYVDEEDAFERAIEIIEGK